MELRGKTILITGGRRVGRVVAAELAATGAQIAMTYWSGKSDTEETVAELRQLPGIAARAYATDLTRESSIRALLDQVRNDFGGLDGLVNMASLYEKDPAAIDLTIINRLFTINAFSGMLLSRLFADERRAAKARNVPIVTFSDWAVEHPYAEYGLYLAAKAALQYYLRTLQTDFSGTVRVVNILPGMIAPMDEVVSAAEKTLIIDNTPTRTRGTPEQAAHLTRAALENDFLVGDIDLSGGQQWRHRFP